MCARCVHHQGQQKNWGCARGIWHRAAVKKTASCCRNTAAQSTAGQTPYSGCCCETVMSGACQDGSQAGSQQQASRNACYLPFPQSACMVLPICQHLFAHTPKQHAHVGARLQRTPHLGFTAAHPASKHTTGCVVWAAASAHKGMIKARKTKGPHGYVQSRAPIHLCGALKGRLAK